MNAVIEQTNSGRWCVRATAGGDHTVTVGTYTAKYQAKAHADRINHERNT